MVIRFTSATMIAPMSRFNPPHCLFLRKRHLVLLLCIIAIIIVRQVPQGGAYYTTHVYPIVATCLSHLSSWIPFPLGDIFILVAILLLLVVPPYLLVRKGCTKRYVAQLVVESLAWIYVWFYVAWGLNYSQPNIYQRLHMVPAKVSTDRFLQFAKSVVDSVNATYMPDSMISLSASVAHIHQGYQSLAAHHPIGINPPFNPNVHGKTMLFSWLSSQAGVTGSMAPFFCEFTINADVLSHNYPSTYAHEYAHMLGITNEGEANFYSYLICATSPYRAVRYSGYLHLLPHVMREASQLLSPREQSSLLASINPAIIALLRSDARYWQSRRNQLIDSVQSALFNLYLKSNHVEEGIHSYSGVVAIIMAWDERQ